MSARRLGVLVAGVASALLAVGCNGPTPADLFLVMRTGTVAGARLDLRVTDDGGAFCNRGGRKEITSAQLITAREIRRELDGDPSDDSKPALATKNINLPPGAITSYTYRVRSEKGTVVFSDTSARQPKTFYRLAQLTREVARGSCGLQR